MNSVIEDVKTEKIERPAKLWENRFRIRERVQDRDTGGILQPGYEFVGRGPWPSKEVAEQKALGREDVQQGVSEYLGAFPVSP